ncbi:hypothetical protein EVAR_84200_1 [Eumeta japonica]|uniref:Uncharacterized protein n=1 Tax=Eumeta variegata TaxID=151549 RepID=A0A4C1SB77_EUMVA|nr:hypothetical protein EVAR_84200_1 [Eumeta japonica]
MPESRVTSVQMNSAGAPPSPKRRQRTMIGSAVVRQKGPGDTEMTSHMAQTFTGHGGFAQYLFRFAGDSPTAPATPSKFRMCCTFSRTVICSSERCGTRSGNWCRGLEAALPGDSG